MKANINNVLEKATIIGDIFKILLQNLKNNSGNYLERIGFVSFYKDDKTGYFLSVHGDKKDNYKMQIDEIGCGIVDSVKIELTPFQYNVLETVFDLEVKKILNANFRRIS